jgi:adenylate kinase family enzyme
MRRVAVIGCSGGGKSTLARKLGAKLSLPVVHLDVVFWLPGWVESETGPMRERLLAATEDGAWVVDGNFTGRVADLTLGRADTIVWIDQPRRVCLWRAVWRAISQQGRTRADMAPGCNEKFDLNFYAYVWNWGRDTRPKVEAAIARYAPNIPLIRLRSDAEIAAFLDRA